MLPHEKGSNSCSVTVISDLTMLRSCLQRISVLFLMMIHGLPAHASAKKSLTLGASTFTALGTFPTSLYSTYYNNPTQTASQVQPIIFDPVKDFTFPLDLTSPDTIPVNDSSDPDPFPFQVNHEDLLSVVLRQMSLAFQPETPNSPFVSDRCSACLASLGLIKMLSLASPRKGPAAIVALCQFLGLPDCTTLVGPVGLGNVAMQVLALADTAGYDGQYFCNTFGSACPIPPTSSLDLTDWFAKPKPNPLPPPRKPSGKRLKVLHLSDFHIDPRYATGSEANCTSQSLCCRRNTFADSSPREPINPAPRYGSFLCDTPFALAGAVFEAIPALTGTVDTGFDFSIFTGDLVSHDPNNELSRDYVMYTETVLYDLMKKISGPNSNVYAVLGNHDTHQFDQAAPHVLGGKFGTQFMWNYNHVASLWRIEKWLPASAISLARKHYGAYMVRRNDGLRIITINTDFWYVDNLFNYFNMTQMDVSKSLRFLTNQLQDAEDAGERVWIIGHVLSGWDGTNALKNPTDLFYQIVDRFSPHVIANIFFGHTHQDQFSIFYSNNGTIMNRNTAQTVSWVGPSITPIENVNSGFRVYEVDSHTFDIVDAFTWFSDVNTFSSLDDQKKHGPTYELEYNTREAFGASIPGWGPDDPLNATWWHLVTEAMQSDPALVHTFNHFQGKKSVFTKECLSDCAEARICYMRSGSASLAQQNCLPGFGSSVEMPVELSE